MRRFLVLALISSLYLGCSGEGATPVLVMDQSGTTDTVEELATSSDVPAETVVDSRVDLPDVQVPPKDLQVELIEVVEVDICQPDCKGKACGPDGCGGTCGECLSWCFPGCESGEPFPVPEACNLESGVCGSACCPNCCNKECGDDGCGGVCGECPENGYCTPGGGCGCDFLSCGEGCCAEGEICIGDVAEQDVCCLPDCEGKICGGDGCGGSCGKCKKGFDCIDGEECVCAFEGCGDNCCGDGQACTPVGCCLPICEGKECGDDGCGYDCGTCEGNTTCDADKCVCAFDICGESCCAETELCIDGACCQADCNGKVCGSDGCGGSCGSCSANQVCLGEGKCVCQFAPCGGACCAATEICFEGACCESLCGAVECGDDGCGGDCGECDAGCYCGGGTCLGSCGECLPDCAGKECGWDGCGGSCGICNGNTQCNTQTWQCDPGKCSLPTEFPGDSFKMNSLKAGENGHEDEAVDVDNDPTSCAPANMCSGGRDNSFGALMKSLAPALGGSEPLMDAVEAGDIVMMVQLIEPKDDGSIFLANIYRGSPVEPQNQCDFQSETCDYLVTEESFVKKTCLSITAFDNVQMKGGTITAGGPQYAFEFPFVLALTGGQEVVLPATHAKMVADVEVDNQGNIIGLEGIIGCAVTKAAIIDMVDQIPAEALPVSKDLIMAVLAMVVVADIDADGDGTKESVSTGMKFTAIPANLVGLGN